MKCILLSPEKKLAQVSLVIIEKNRLTSTHPNSKNWRHRAET